MGWVCICPTIPEVNLEYPMLTENSRSVYGNEYYEKGICYVDASAHFSYKEMFAED